MSYNFKSIADVEVVAEPAESANVLIEENGVIKKAPKTAVGGSGSGFDFVIRQNPNDWRVGNLIIGTYEDIYNKFINNEFIIGLYWGTTSFNSAGYNIDMCCDICPDEDNGKPVFTVWFHNYGDTARIYEDNTVEFQSTD